MYIIWNVDGYLLNHIIDKHKMIRVEKEQILLLYINRTHKQNTCSFTLLCAQRDDALSPSW